MMRDSKLKGVVQTNVTYEGTSLLLAYKMKINEGKFTDWIKKDRYDLLAEQRSLAKSKTTKGNLDGICLYMKLLQELASEREVAENIKEMLQKKS